MFSYGEVRTSIGDGNVPGDERDIDLPRLDSESRLAVGRDGTGAYVLVGPGQPTASSRAGKYFRFDPWKELIDRRSKIILTDVSVLRFRPEDSGVDVQDAIAAVFTGLLDLAAAMPEGLADAIRAMEALFEAGLKSSVLRDVEIGLAGELLAIVESAQPSRLVATWHTRAEGLFDFSAQGERLEVKTTTSAERLHWFSSGQVSPIPGVCSSFLSVVLPLVEVGSTVSSIFASMSDALTVDERARVRSVVIDTAKEPPELLNSIVFDRAAARASFLHVEAGEVPRPQPVPGVGRMRWEATLSQDLRPPSMRCSFGVALFGP